MCNKRHKLLNLVHSLFNRVSLRTTLLIYVIVPLALALAFTGHMALSVLEKNIEKGMQRDLELIAQAIQLPLSYALERGETKAIYSALDSAFSIGEIYSASLFDQNGDEVALAGTLESEPQSEKLSDLIDEGEEHGGYGDVAGREVYSHFIPLFDSGGKVNGMLQLTRKKSDITNYIRTIRMQGQLVLGLSLLIMTILVLFGQQRALGKYIQNLITSMSRVARGDRKHRFQLQGPKEIVAIGTQFNHMLDSIEGAQEEIKQRRRKQEILQEKLRKSEKLAAVGRLSAGIAHELGTPLSIVTARAQRALRKKDLSQDLKTTFTSIRGEVSRMEYIIRQLLDFSRSSSLQKRPVTLSMVARSALAGISEEAKKQEVLLEAGGEQGENSILMDPVRIEQVLVNLLRNAVQAAANGQVILSWGLDDGWAWYQVEDSGPGIDEDIRPRLFEPFFTTKNVGSGTGLGLSVAHGIIEEHQGKIETGQSRLGGACFRVFLPAYNSKQTAEKAYPAINDNQT
ncbi:MAG: HAMP domain-containing sensor histidine kinase [Desulfonatronovibrio sp.]